MENITPTPIQNMPAEKPSNYLILAIVSTFLCCNVTGIISIIYAAQVNAKWEGGNYEGAISDSKNAKLWVIIGLCCALLLILPLLLIFGAGIIAALNDAAGGSYSGY